MRGEHRPMAIIGYHASHEQFTPADLLTHAGHALDAGFQAVMCSDHFHPWSRAQGQSGHAWCWLGAMMASSEAPCGVVTCPSGRYHPAVVAQAAATLAQMFPARLWLAVGSGEALNESITGSPGPTRPRATSACARRCCRFPKRRGTPRTPTSRTVSKRSTGRAISCSASSATSRTGASITSVRCGRHGARWSSRCWRRRSRRTVMRTGSSRA